MYDSHSMSQTESVKVSQYWAVLDFNGDQKRLKKHHLTWKEPFRTAWSFNLTKFERLSQIALLQQHEQIQHDQFDIIQHELWENGTRKFFCFEGLRVAINRSVNSIEWVIYCRLVEKVSCYSSINQRTLLQGKHSWFNTLGTLLCFLLNVGAHIQRI